jgi:hypothetical protein
VRGACWVEPRFIATVKHFGRTDSGVLRRCAARACRRIAGLIPVRVPAQDAGNRIDTRERQLT